MVQWADILTTLHVLGHNLKISLSVKELQGWVHQSTVKQCSFILKAWFASVQIPKLKPISNWAKPLDCQPHTRWPVLIGCLVFVLWKDSTFVVHYCFFRFQLQKICIIAVRTYRSHLSYWLLSYNLVQFNYFCSFGFSFIISLQHNCFSFSWITLCRSPKKVGLQLVAPQKKGAWRPLIWCCRVAFRTTDSSHIYTSQSGRVYCSFTQNLSGRF